jgi:hypothetical protein
MEEINAARSMLWLWANSNGILASGKGIFSQSTWRRPSSYSRLATRWGQSEGQSMLTSRSVPQQTEQMFSPLAGQNLFTLRLLQIGQVN